MSDAAHTDHRLTTRPDIFGTSRLAVLTLLGIASGAIPLPYIPEGIQKYLRGALIHDIASGHHLSLTEDAREVLAAPDQAAPSHRWATGAAGFMLQRVLRRIGPLALLAPARAGFELFALGILFERYIRIVRRGPSVRINGAEARGVRKAIDGALLRAFHPKLTPSTVPHGTVLTDDLRSDRIRIMDTLLLGGANFPGYIVRRIEGAFDAVIAENPEWVDGG